MATKRTNKEVLTKPPVVESPVEIQQYEIDWAKIATQVQEAAELVKSGTTQVIEEKPKKTTRKKK